MRLDRRRLVFVAKAELQRELRRRLEVVLRVAGIVERPAGQVQRHADTGVVHAPEEKRREGMADEIDAWNTGLRRREVERASKVPKRLRVQLIPAYVGADLHEVATLRPAERIRHAPGVVGLEVVLRIPDRIEADPRGSGAPRDAGARPILSHTLDAEQRAARVGDVRRPVRVRHAVERQNQAVVKRRRDREIMRHAGEPRVDHLTPRGRQRSADGIVRVPDTARVKEQARPRVAREAAAETLPRRHDLVDLERPLVLIEFGRVLRREQVIGRQRVVDRHIVLLRNLADPAGDLADAVRRDDVTGERVRDEHSVHLPERQRIVNGAPENRTPQRVGPDDGAREQPAQVAVVHLQLRHRAVWRGIDVTAHLEFFRRREEEGAVMTVVHARNPDRAAEAAAVIRLPIAWLRPAGGLVEERIRVQRLVPESPEAGPMHLVLTGTHDEVEHSSARSAEFR